MAAAVTEALTGAGIWGVEFFLSKGKRRLFFGTFATSA